MSRSQPTVPRTLRWGGVLACAVVILGASVVDPGEGEPTRLFGVGITVYLHLLAYAGLTGAVGYALLRADRQALLAAAGVAVLYGVGVELVQWPLAYRTASVLDVLVNAAGAAAGASLWWAVAPLFGAERDADGTTSI